MYEFKYITSKKKACEIISQVSKIPLDNKNKNYQCEVTEDGYYIQIEKLPTLMMVTGKYFLIHNDFEVSVWNNITDTFQPNEILTLNFRIQTARASGKKEEYVGDLQNFLQSKVNKQVNAVKHDYIASDKSK